MADDMSTFVVPLDNDYDYESEDLDYTDGSEYIEPLSEVVGGKAVIVRQPAVIQTTLIPSTLFKPGECAPVVGNDTVCSTVGTLDRIRKWIAQQDAEPVKTARDIIEKAKHATKCDSESCLFTKRSALLDYITQGVAKKELQERFAPRGPHNNTNWLSNDNIDQVLELYVKKFPEFYHCEYQMCDFEKVGGKLATLDFVDISNNYKSLGCVLNTDNSGGPGQHWTAIYVDFQSGTFEYWDSAGDPPFPEIHDFMVRQVDILNTVGKKFRTVVVCSDLVHQKGDTECGVYSLYYIINRLNGVPYKFFQQNEIPDDVMQMFRKYLFRHS